MWSSRGIPIVELPLFQHNGTREFLNYCSKKAIMMFFEELITLGRRDENNPNYSLITTHKNCSQFISLLNITFSNVLLFSADV